MAPSGIEPATCRFVAQCLNHYATVRPHIQTKLNEKYFEIKKYSLYSYSVFIKPHLMYHFSYTKSSCLSNTPTRFGARRRHLQGGPSQLVHHVVGELLETI